MIGWGNLTAAGSALVADIGYVSGRAPRDAVYRAGLDEELARIRAFLDQPRQVRSAPVSK